MSRCQTGWKIRKDQKTTNPNKRWEAYHNSYGPLYRQFPDFDQAVAFVYRCTCLMVDIDAPIPFSLA